MTTRRTTATAAFLAATAATAASTIGFLWSPPDADTARTTGTTMASHVAPVDRLEEDEVGWDCATMGNKVCGPTALPPGCDLTYHWDGVTLTPATVTEADAACLIPDLLYPVATR